MTLRQGVRLGPYEIVSPLGAGGMGEVYKARDTRLDRTVAVKVLGSQVIAGSELKERFEREARLIAGLNHPHICVLHDVGEHEGTDYLVMEYLEGETLAARLAKGALSLQQALQYATQIADALDKAHRQGVIHRDLKPQNIMLTKSGAKLLDFGLAKLTALPSAAGALSTLPTQSPTLTAEGTILGTFQYMAPEQLEGKEAGTRTDLFAFGVVLYEMVTGKKAFQGKSQASLIGAILEREPEPLSKLQPMSPPALEHLVRTCLTKDPEERRQTAHDVLLELRWISDQAASALESEGASISTKRGRLGWVVAAALAIAFASFFFLQSPEDAGRDHPLRFALSPDMATLGSPVVSPDGRHIVFAGTAPDRPSQLWIRSLDSLAPRPLDGTEGGLNPFWSPDSNQIAFSAEGKLKTIALAGGSVQTLCDLPAARGGSWGEEGVIIFSPEVFGPLYSVSAAGGIPSPMTNLDRSRGETAHRWPYFLPDGKRFLFLALGTDERQGIYVGSLESKQVQFVVSSRLNVVYAPPGYLLFLREGVLMGQPFNLKDARLEGDPFRIAEDVNWEEHSFFRRGLFSVSGNGTLAYRTKSRAVRHRLVWLNRQGKEIGALEQIEEYSNIDLSPDDKRLAVCVKDPRKATRDVWIFDLAQGTSSRLTSEPSDETNPVWSPDGSRIAFTSERRGQRDLYAKHAVTGKEELLLASSDSKNLEDWSADGRRLFFNIGGRWEVQFLTLSGERKAAPFLGEQFSPNHTRLSPNGRWVAYTSNQSGKGEIHVQSFPPGGEVWRISKAGGIQPHWRSDGRELFYVELNRGTRLMSVAVTLEGDSFRHGTPRVLFEVPAPPSGAFRTIYDIDSKGERFFFITQAEEKPSGPAAEFAVIVDWTAGLAR